MIREITSGNEVLRFKCSAGTGILFRKAFCKDVTREYSKFISLKDKLKNIDPESITEEEAEMLTTISETSEELSRELSFVMYAEANKSVDEVMDYVSDNNNYFKYLCSIESDWLKAHSMEFLTMYMNSGMSKIKSPL